MDFFERFPLAVSGGVLSSIGFEDLKPIALVVLAFIVDISMKGIYRRFNDKNKNDGGNT